MPVALVGSEVTPDRRWGDLDDAGAAGQVDDPLELVVAEPPDRALDRGWGVDLHRGVRTRRSDAGDEGVARNRSVDVGGRRHGMASDRHGSREAQDQQ